MPLIENTQIITSRHDLHTATGNSSSIQPGPHRNNRIGINPPAHTDILMPGQNRAALSGFIHKHRAKNRNIFADIATGNLADKGMLHISEKKRILFQIINTSIMERRFLIPQSAIHSDIRRFGIELKAHIPIADAAQHNIVDALL